MGMDKYDAVRRSENLMSFISGLDKIETEIGNSKYDKRTGKDIVVCGYQLEHGGSLNILASTDKYKNLSFGKKLNMAGIDEIGDIVYKANNMWGSAERVKQYINKFNSCSTVITPIKVGDDISITIKTIDEKIRTISSYVTNIVWRIDAETNKVYGTLVTKSSNATDKSNKVCFY